MRLALHELEIFPLVIVGKINKASANETYIRAKTVECHLDNLSTSVDMYTEGGRSLAVIA
jgi:FixJ family two-component response regulator